MYFLIFRSSGKPYDRPCSFKKDEKFINGLTEYELTLNEHIPIEKSNVFERRAHKDGEITQLNFFNLRPGTVVAIRVSMHDCTRSHFDQLEQLLKSFRTRSGKKYEEIKEVVAKLNFIDLNRALYRCDQEERDMGNPSGTYDIPNFGPMVYCGTQGFVSLLTEIAPKNDLGHPMCNNLRDGNWMIDYIHNRLAANAGTASLAHWIEENTIDLKAIPRYLIPSYFDVIVTGIHHLLINRSIELMAPFIRDGSNFVKTLAQGSVQCIAVCDSADLPKLSPKLPSPKPPTTPCATLSAGLPHFSTGYMRCWGRDTFIALRGLMILTGRFDEARFTILGFAACLRHGLIPNLLDNGTKPRFNCRDAVWWWLNSIKDYVNEAPNGKAILNDPVSRLFPTDDSEAKAAGECVSREFA